MNSAFIFIILAFFPLKSFSQAPASHCSNDESTYFSCSTGKKIISVCGSNKLALNSGYLQYRFGPAGAPEIALPKSKAITPGTTFSYIYNSHRALGAWLIVLETKSGDFSYEVFGLQGEGENEPKYGVTVHKKEAKIAEIKCKGKVIDRLGDLRDLDWPE